jgi:DNA-binding NtrC family response regulator
MPTRILVVEDDSVGRSLFVDILTTHLGNAVVDQAEDGQQALDRVAQHLYDVIFTDLNMPGMSGHDLLKLTKVLQPDVPVVVISGLADAQTRYELIADGAYDALAKPVEVPQLVSIARHAAEAAKLARQLAVMRHNAGQQTKGAYVGCEDASAGLGSPNQLRLPWQPLSTQ